jgi:hypothetical protein
MILKTPQCTDLLTVRAVRQRAKILYCMCEQSPVGQLAKNVYPDRVSIVRAIAACLVGVSKSRGVFERGGGWAIGNMYRRYRKMNNVSELLLRSLLLCALCVHTRVVLRIVG